MIAIELPCHRHFTPKGNKASVEFSSVAQLFPNLCHPMDCSTPGFPVHHQCPELAQTHVHWIGDAFHHPILCCPLLLLPSVFPSIRVLFQQVISLHVFPKYWSFSFSISTSNEFQNWFPLGLTGLILESKGLSRVFSNTTLQKHQFFGSQLALWSNSHIHTWLLGKP